MGEEKKGEENKPALLPVCGLWRGEQKGVSCTSGGLGHGRFLVIRQFNGRGGEKGPDAMLWLGEGDAKTDAAKPEKEMRQFCGLFERQGKKGLFWSGDFSERVGVLVFKNHKREGKNDPDLTVNFVPREKRERKQGGGEGAGGPDGYPF